MTYEKISETTICYNAIIRNTIFDFSYEHARLLYRCTILGTLIHFSHEYDYYVPNGWYIIRNIINMFTMESKHCMLNMVLATSYETFIASCFDSDSDTVTVKQDE